MTGRTEPEDRVRVAGLLSYGLVLTNGITVPALV
jgi:hypothetical protein